MIRAALCADVGSTYTKAALVDLESGRLVGTASHRTTLDTDVLDGLDAVRAALAADSPTTQVEEVLVCSSAGGGLRLAVVGYERVITAEAGRLVGLSSGARVVHVASGRLDETGIVKLLATRPDVLLLVGGTNGGNADVIEHNASRLAASQLRCPVVVAGNADARTAACAVLAEHAKTVITAANVLPRIGALDPQPARQAIREVFIRHVIGGKRLSHRGSTFAGLVRAATPDAVLSGVELLADGTPVAPGVGDVVVVDVGGATTDVYSVVKPDPEDAALRREVVGVSWRGRTVEGDLGVRWNAPGVLSAARAERLLSPDELVALEPAAAARAADPALLAGAEDGVDERLATLAATVAVRRHARPYEACTSAGETVRRGGRDLRDVRLVVGSGGVLRHAPSAGTRILAVVVGDVGGGWQVPERATLVVDRSYVLAAAGLLALTGRSSVGARLLRSSLA